MGWRGIGQAGLALSVLVAAVGGAAAAPSPLARYVDQARVVVVSAPSPGDPRLARQEAALVAEAAGLEARNVVVLRAVGASADADHLRTAAGLSPGGFAVALVGKDGGVKLRRTEPVSAEALFRTIDAMPMRRWEMDGRDGAGGPQ